LSISLFCMLILYIITTLILKRFGFDL
jgi:hypothetical protein